MFDFLAKLSYSELAIMLPSIAAACYGTYKAMKSDVTKLQDRVTQMEQDRAVDNARSTSKLEAHDDELAELRSDRDKMVTRMETMFTELRADIKLLLQRK
ncbi:hypothetical protein CK627_20930 [Aeromonas dhakensis]|uniref:hypothetical protein n=1 Tax=Aeromonas dhakensis TaxID=196024 RepID=UPI000BAB02F7|nr:hypothetical protein [Aeromonas dhakensis]ASX13074.1 hypothetical protein CK627_20930 [Aeromonas dhakensis]